MWKYQIKKKQKLSVKKKTLSFNAQSSPDLNKENGLNICLCFEFG